MSQTNFKLYGKLENLILELEYFLINSSTLKPDFRMILSECEKIYEYYKDHEYKPIHDLMVTLKSEYIPKIKEKLKQ